jgi:hypothetical protein
MAMSHRALLLLWLTACSASAPAVKPPSDVQAVGGADTTVTMASDPAAKGCVSPPDRSPLKADALRLRADAVDALDHGRAVSAKKLLERMLELNPANSAAAALLLGAEKTIEAGRKGAALTLERHKRITPQAPPAVHDLPRPVLVSGDVAPPSISNQRQQRNKVIDDQKWYREHGLRLPLIARADRGSHMPDQLAGYRLNTVIDHGDHHVLIYSGTFAVVMRRDGAIISVLDLRTFNAGPRTTPLKWAQARDGVLYMMNANPHYARESKGKNGFLTAINLSGGSLRWRSRPLVANAQNFILRGNHIISGYGFTAEKDALYVLDRGTGKVVKEIALGTKPGVILEKGGKLHIRGYNTDYSFDITGAAPSAVGPAQGSAQLTVSTADASAPLEPTTEDVCRRDAALIHVDHGRFADAAGALWKLSRHYKTSPAVGSLREFVNKAQAGQLIDLQRVAVRVERPPFSQTTGRHPTIASSKPPRLKQRASKRNRIIDKQAWLTKHGATYPGRRVPNRWSREPSELPVDVPLRFGTHQISAAQIYADHSALIYGGRFVAIAQGGKATTVLDFESFIKPPSVREPTDARFALQKVTWAEYRDGVVYVANGGGSYASAVFGKKGYLTAVDAKTGALLWRSSPLVCGANFVIDDGHIITGYGFTAEPDNLFVIDRQTGRTVSKTSLASAPSMIVRKDNQLYVRTYDTDYEFDLL